MKTKDVCPFCEKPEKDCGAYAYALLKGFSESQMERYFSIFHHVDYKDGKPVTPGARRDEKTPPKKGGPS